MIELDILQEELKALPKEKKLALAHWLLDSLAGSSNKDLPLVEIVGQEEENAGPLSEWVGIFSGGPGDTAERDEEILEAEIDLGPTAF
jgi:hypothetical protein